MTNNKVHSTVDVTDNYNKITAYGSDPAYLDIYKEYVRLMDEQSKRKVGLYSGSEPDKPIPGLKGIVGLYSGKGLTNTEMSANPVWKDLSGNGHDLQMKGFLWGGMSGVGGVSTYYDKYEFTPDQYYMVAVPSRTQHAQFTFKVTGLVDGNTLSLADTSSPSNIYGKWTQDGIYTVDIDVINTDKSIYFYNGVSAIRGTFTIEILPLYPGALVFDGVDDYGICDSFPILTKEKGYTVMALRQWISDKNNQCLISNRKGATAANNAFNFEIRIADSESTRSFTSVDTIVKYPSTPFSYQTSLLYNNDTKLPTGYTEGVDTLIVGSLSSNVFPANAAIYSICIIDHDTTEEERQKVIDYWKKEYPWLFFDQAWTVTGKTNEDADRATIKNLTGNGNNLMLSNFAFAEDSGYGLYTENYNNDRWFINSSIVAIKNNHRFKITQIKQIAVQIQYVTLSNQESFIVPSYAIKITGLIDGQTLFYRSSDGASFLIEQDGIYTLPQLEVSAMGSWFGFQFNKTQDSCNITIEQIPEYAGYLVTDGVDDKIRSSSFNLGKDWTVVGDWEFLKEDTVKLSGIVKFDSFILYNYSYQNKVNVYIKNPYGTEFSANTVKALTSEGKIYLDFNDDRQVKVGELLDKGNQLIIGNNGNGYTKLAFKFLAIYPIVLSKDDCIKAYNYLQTLKEKQSWNL